MAPVIIESTMKVSIPAISNCLVIGDRRKFLVMLVALKCEVDADTGEPTDRLNSEALRLGKSLGSEAETVSDASRDPIWIKYIDDGVKAGNAKACSRAQIVQKWTILPIDLSEKQGLLTPTLKVKRTVVDRVYKELIDSLYE